MTKKTTIQFVLFLIIIFILIITFFKYFNKPQKEAFLKNKKESISQELDSKNQKSNIIENIEYLATDSLGNRYVIKAESGYLDDADSKLIIMNGANAEIIFANSEKIYIESSSAIYNTLSFDTQFKGNIKIIYGLHKINCEKSELIFSENLAKLYDNIIYENIDTKLFADKMEIDLITKDTKVYMNDANAKVKIIHKNKNGNN